MNSISDESQGGGSDLSKPQGGTPENTSLRVRQVQERWIVETETGESIAEASSKSEALEMAQIKVREKRSSGISVQ
jgi:hypothetical protein